MKPIIYRTPASNDSDDVRFDDNGTIRGYGFLPKNETFPTIHLVKCPKCNRENYAFNVSSGACSWCPFDTKKLTFGTEKVEV